MGRFLKKFPKVKKIVYYGTRRKTEYVRLSFSRNSSVSTPVHSSGVQSTATEFESIPSSSASSLQASHVNADTDNKMGVKKLRGQVQVHMNNLYSKAVGKHQKFPYRKVAAGQIRIEGLPEDVLPLKLPSHYGERRLKAFLKCLEIKVQKMDMAVHTESEYSGVMQDPTNILPALNISPTTHNFMQSAPMEISPVSHTSLPGLNNISPTTHNFIEKADIEIQPVSHTISPLHQKPAIHKSTSTQGTCIKKKKRLKDNQLEHSESHSQWTKSTSIPGPLDLCFKKKIRTYKFGYNSCVYMVNCVNLFYCSEVYIVTAIHAQRKVRGILQYLVEWEGYTIKEATWEPKRNIPEEIINSLEKYNITSTRNKSFYSIFLTTFSSY
ncbi:hypothetical protein ACJMK2_043222 [Sinanodonta woodiana]|uniref:Chromo domain-containing protein n=1 Tax=Sinanodonta woodiana TaxID=1069815 RepID=A0ABD3VZE2_SINWO